MECIIFTEDLVLTQAMDEDAYNALQTGKSHSATAFRTNDFWCIGCIVDQNGGIVAISNCYSAGQSADWTPSWFDSVADVNKASRNDSECKVLCDLENGGQVHLINATDVAATNNRLVMYGSYGPCGSCKRVIASFRKHYRITATILYVEKKIKVVSAIWKNGTEYGWDTAAAEQTTSGVKLWVQRF
jgi:hypothetical protein